MNETTEQSAERLREAADRLDERVRDDSSVFDEEWQALAAWLREAAMRRDVGSDFSDSAQAVANAILGGGASHE